MEEVTGQLGGEQKKHFSIRREHEYKLQNIKMQIFIAVSLEN